MTTTPHTTEPTRQDEHTNDTASDLTTHVDVIEASMATITDILTNPTAELFHTHRSDIIRLLKTISHTDTLYAAFAYAAHEAHVSRVAGTTRTSTYLARLLDTSEYQARQWINLGISLYKPPEPPADKTTTNGEDDAANGEDSADDAVQNRADQLAERRRAHEAHQAHLAAQAQARKQARKLSDAKLAEINRELEHLHPSLHEEHHHILFDNATTMATTTTVDDLKLHLRTQVRTLNSSVVDPTADYRARKLVWSPADTHGNIRLTAVLPRTGHALLETLMSPARLAAFDRSRGVNTDEDRRTMPQRRADVFMSMLETWAEDADAATAPRTRGLASLVVALSAKDLTTLPTTNDDAGAGATTTGTTGHSSSGAVDSAPLAPHTAESLNAPGVWFPTNTNARLHPIDILRLGLAEHDLGVVLDPDSGRALTAARMKRHATVEQKLMLVAEQLCCAYPGCNRAAVDCDVHHIKAWSRGGRTTVDNLTLLCRTHHRMNRDQHDGGVGMGHAEVDPDSGRVGWREARHHHEGLPDLPGAPPTTSTTAREGSGTGQEQPSRGGSGVRPRPHPRLSDTVVVNTSTTASQAPGAQVPDQAWGSEEVQALFDPPQPQSPRHHGDRAS